MNLNEKLCKAIEYIMTNKGLFIRKPDCYIHTDKDDVEISLTPKTMDYYLFLSVICKLISENKATFEIMDKDVPANTLSYLENLSENFSKE